MDVQKAEEAVRQVYDGLCALAEALPNETLKRQIHDRTSTLPELLFTQNLDLIQLAEYNLDYAEIMGRVSPLSVAFRERLHLIAFGRPRPDVYARPQPSDGRVTGSPTPLSA